MTSFRVKIILAILMILGAFFAGTRVQAPSVVIEKPVPQVTTIEVPKITEKIVTQYIPVEDRKRVIALLNENKQLKLNIQQLSVSLAEAQSSGRGTAVVDAPPCPSLPDAPPVRVSFADYRLSFQSVGDQASYTLTQKFSIVNSVSKTAKGTDVNLIRLYEIGPGATRTLIPTTETTTLTVTPSSHWYRFASIHAGVVVAPISTSKQNTTSYTTQKGGAMAITWLKYGSTRATQDTRYAALSPSVIWLPNETSIGVLPVSLNLGTLPRQPFTNLWVSPFLGTQGTTLSLKRFGIVFSSSF